MCETGATGKRPATLWRSLENKLHSELTQNA
jgi:hypothetical protein